MLFAAKLGGRKRNRGWREKVARSSDHKLNINISDEISNMFHQQANFILSIIMIYNDMILYIFYFFSHSNSLDIYQNNIFIDFYR